MKKQQITLRQPDMPAHHGGDIYRNPVQHDFSINLNPLGMPEGVKQRLRETVEDWARYPDTQCEALRAELAAFHQVPADTILCSNGAADLIYQLVRTLQPRQALLPAPGFAEYEQALLHVNCEIRYVRLKPENKFLPDIHQFCEQITPDTDLVFFCNPNNPTGHAVPKCQILQLAARCQETGTRLILDECFCDLLNDPEMFSVIPEAEQFPNLFILRAFTKTYAMAGLRLGYGICADQALLQKLSEGRQPWSISVPAQEAGCAALEETAYLKEARVLLKDGRDYLTGELRCLGFTVYDSDINFILFFYEEEPRPLYLYEACLKRGVLLRDCSNFTGLSHGYYRVCVSRPDENEVLVHTLEQILEDTKKSKGEGRS